MDVAKAALEPLLLKAVKAGLLDARIAEAVQIVGYLAATEAADYVEGQKASVKAGLRRAGAAVPRACFKDFNSTVQAAIAAKENYATVVYGPRGVGKTCMVSAGLQVSHAAAKCVMLRAGASSCAWMSCGRESSSHSLMRSAPVIHYFLALLPLAACLLPRRSNASWQAMSGLLPRTMGMATPT